MSVDALISLAGLLLQERRHDVGREVLRRADATVLLILRLRRLDVARGCLSSAENKLIVLLQVQADATI